MKKYINIFIALFLFFNIFDPADLLFKLKMPLFIICWLLFLYDIALNPEKPILLKTLFYKVFIFIFIPLFSILIYLSLDGTAPYEGLQLFKSYLFFTLTLILYYYKFNVLKQLSIILSALSILIIFLHYFLISFPFFVPIITSIGSDYGIFLIGNRSYSDDFTIFNIFFVTSPLLVISISFYVYTFMKLKSKSSFFLAFINIIAMFFAGTRNNLFVSILLPISIYIYYAKYKKVNITIIFLVLIFTIYQFKEKILILFNSDETSNSTKLFLFSDYVEIFSNFKIILFGQGIGSYVFFKTRGSYDYISELTYLEIFRNYGLILGSILILILFYPFYLTYNNIKYYDNKFIIIAYGFYLFMCFSNPWLFSSIGILIVSIVYSMLYITKNSKI